MNRRGSASELTPNESFESAQFVRPSRVAKQVEQVAHLLGFFLGCGIPREFFHAYKLVFLCEYLKGEPGPSDETSAAEFFDFNHLPPLSSPRTEERHLVEVQAHLRDPQRATAFD